MYKQLNLHVFHEFADNLSFRSGLISVITLWQNLCYFTKAHFFLSPKSVWGIMCVFHTYTESHCSLFLSLVAWL